MLCVVLQDDSQWCCLIAHLSPPLQRALRFHSSALRVHLSHLSHRRSHAVSRSPWRPRRCPRPRAAGRRRSPPAARSLCTSPGTPAQHQRIQNTQAGMLIRGSGERTDCFWSERSSGSATGWRTPAGSGSASAAHLSRQWLPCLESADTLSSVRLKILPEREGGAAVWWWWWGLTAGRPRLGPGGEALAPAHRGVEQHVGSGLINGPRFC